MPKKFKGANSHAVESKAREEAKKKEDKERNEREKEDKHWEDEDKLVNRKIGRQQEREAKRNEDLERKKANKLLAEEELEQTANSSKVKSNRKNVSNNRLTRAEIANAQARLLAELDKLAVKEKPNNLVQVDVMTENPNKIQTEGESARTVDEAILILNNSEPSVEKHVEKRVKAAWLVYEKKYFSQIKTENPSLKYSQIQARLWENFQKAPENPKNQAFADYNSK